MTIAEKSHGNGQGRAHGGRNAVASVRSVFSLSSPNEERVGVRSLNFVGSCQAWSGLCRLSFPTPLPNEQFFLSESQTQTKLYEPNQTFCPTGGGGGVSETYFGSKTPLIFVNLCSKVFQTVPKPFSEKKIVYFSRTVPPILSCLCAFMSL